MTNKNQAISINAGDLTVPPAEQNLLPMVSEVREFPPVHQYVIDVDRMVRRTSETEVKIALMEVLDLVTQLSTTRPSRDWRPDDKTGEELKNEVIAIIKQALK